MRKLVRKRMVEHGDELHVGAQRRLLPVGACGNYSTSSIRRLRRNEKVRKSGERKSLLDLLNLYVVVLQAIRSSRLKGGQEALVTDKDQGVFCMEETTGNSTVCSVFLGKSKMRREHSGELSFGKEPQVGEGKSTC